MSQPWYDYPIFPGNAYQTQYLGPNTDTPHFAYDVQTPFHTPITAVLPGTVEVADYQAWGGELFIKPDNSSYPEYYFYHPDELEVSQGQHVDAGQVVALSGGENPGYPGAEHPATSAWSSGPHTHVGWFTGWKSTVAGTKPYGPDTASLMAIAKGQGTSLLDFLPGQAGLPGTQQPAIDSGVVGRIGIGAAGVLLIGIGIISLLSATGITQKATGMAKKAAKLAVFV